MRAQATKLGLLSTVGLIVALWPAESRSAPPGEETKAQDPNAPAIQRPKSPGAPTPGPAPKSDPAQPTEDTDVEPPPAPTGEAPAEGEPAPTTDEPEPGGSEEPDPAGLLAPSESAEAEVRPPRPTGPVPQTGISRDEKAARYYDRLYRPADNPGRFTFGARALFMAAGASESRLSGRMAGATVEAGQTWNWIGYALTGTLYGGQTLLGAAQEHEYNLMVGGGPTLGLGRLSLVRAGYLDARVGYDFFYAPTKVSAIGASDGVTESPASVTPHGPRFRLDLGLLLHRTGGGRFRHGVGATLGYQLLVGSFGGDFPRANVLMVGLNYFMG